MTDNDLRVGDKTGQWRDYLRQKCRKQLAEIGREWPHIRSLYIDYKEVERWGKEGIALADEIMENPGKVMEDIRDAVFNHNLIKTPDNKPPKNDAITIRLVGLRKKTNLKDLRADDVNRLVAIEGAIVHRATEVNPRIINAVFRCPAGHFTNKKQGSYVKFVEPDGCATDGCTFKKLELIPKRSKFVDQQRLKIQDSGEGLKPGQQPRIIDAVALDDICDQVYAGERATFNAIVRSTQRIVRGEKSTVFDLYLELISIETGERDFEEITYSEEEEVRIKEIAKSGNALEMISQSIAPSIWGNSEIKKALALQMFGGVTKIHEDGQRTRGEIHIILLGDYGVAKTQLAKFACSQSPRGAFISAVSSSGPGLIGATKQDPEEGGRWFVEAGELPMADLGVACIDEIDKADKDTLNVLYNVMEDGECRISKAAKRTLKARTSLILPGNPKYQKFDLFADIIDQITIPPALVNRADIVFIMVDSNEHDDEISKHILKTNYYGECSAAGKIEKVTEDQKKDILPPIPPKLLKQYIAYSKNNIRPIMNQAAMAKINAYYVKIRANTNPAGAPVTPRQQQSIIRLSEAMAKMRLSQEVTLADVDAALNIFDKCMEVAIKDPKTGKPDFGRIGQGISQAKKNLIAVMREVIQNEPNLSEQLLISKMAERSYTDSVKILSALEEAKRTGDIMEPRQNHYQWVGK